MPQLRNIKTGAVLEYDQTEIDRIKKTKYGKRFEVVAAEKEPEAITAIKTKLAAVKNSDKTDNKKSSVTAPETQE